MQETKQEDVTLYKNNRHVIILPAKALLVKDTFLVEIWNSVLSRNFLIKWLYINHINDVKDALIQLLLIPQRHVL